MKYIVRKILSFALPLIILSVCAHGFLNAFTSMHFYAIGLAALLLASMSFARFVRRIIFAPINILRKALFRF